MTTLTTYTDRCTILAKWLEIRERVIRIMSVYEGMSSTHGAYRYYQDLIESERAAMTKMQRDNPWMAHVMVALGEGTR